MFGVIGFEQNCKLLSVTDPKKLNRQKLFLTVRLANMPLPYWGHILKRAYRSKIYNITGLPLLFNVFRPF